MNKENSNEKSVNDLLDLAISLIFLVLVVYFVYDILLLTHKKKNKSAEIEFKYY
jgi:hypothetical protein